MHNRIILPFLFAEKSITSPIYLDLLQFYVIPQLEHLQPNILFQQDGAPPHWSLNVREYLDNVFPNRWIGRDGPDIMASMVAGYDTTRLLSVGLH